MFEEGARRRGVDRGRRRRCARFKRQPRRKIERSAASNSLEEVTVTARRRVEAAQEVPIPVSVVSGEAGRRRRRVQREPHEGNAARRSSSTRPTRATRRSTSAASARRSGSPTTASSRASASTSTACYYARPGLGDARLPRRRAGRGAARPAGHAVRQEHDGRRDQRHDAASRASRRRRRRGQLRQLRIRAGEGVGHRAALRRKVAGRISFSGTQRDGTSQRRAPATT